MKGSSCWKVNWEVDAYKKSVFRITHDGIFQSWVGYTSFTVFLRMWPIMELYLSRSENVMEASLDMKTLTFVTSDETIHRYSRQKGQVKHQP